MEPPFVLGHEAAGTVVEIGSRVTNLKVGDRVALEPGKTCGKCEACKAGKYNLCHNVIFFATPPVDGVFQEYVAHDAGLCFKLPEIVSTLEGALIEPLAVGIHAANQGKEVPTTIAELESVCDTLVENSITPFALANGPKWTRLYVFHESGSKIRRFRAISGGCCRNRKF